MSIQSKTIAQDSANGSDVVTWTTLLSRISAEFEYMLPTRSEIVARQVALDRTAARLRIRWRAGLDSTMRVILHGGTDTLYQIVGGPVEIEGHRRRLELYLEKYSTAGDAP